MSRHTIVAHTPFSVRRAHQDIDAIADEAIPAGHTLVVTVEVDDGPTAKMRGKFHAMCGDIARQVEWYGNKQPLAKWKAIFIGAAIEQEWLPGLDGKPVPYRPSSENLSRKKYCDCIAVAQAFGDEQGVKWSDEATQSIEQKAS